MNDEELQKRKNRPKRNYNSILDSALFSIDFHEDSGDAGMSFELSMNMYELSTIERKEIKRKLVKDGFAYFENGDEKKVRITLEGMEFKQNSGYNKKECRTNIIFYLKLFVEVATCIGIVLAGVYGAFEIWKYYHGYVPLRLLK